MKMISFFVPPKSGAPQLLTNTKKSIRLLGLLCVFSITFMCSFSANAQAPTSTCDDPIEVSSTICGNDTNPNTPSGGWGAIPNDGLLTLLFGFPGGAFIEIDFNCLQDDTDAVGDLEIRLASSAFVTGANPCSIYLENVYDIRDSDGNESLGLVTILVEFTGCSADTEAPVVSCTEFSATFDDCPVGLGPNTPNGDWVPIPSSGMINNAVGGIYTAILDVSTCITDDNSALEEMEFTLVDSYSENSIPGCSIDLINEFGVRDACGNVAASTFVFRGTIQYSGPAPMITCPPNVGVECGTSLDPSATGMATATSGCGTPVLSYDDVLAPACGSTGVITRTWTATDACGQTTTCEQIITTFDTQAPVPPVAPAPIVVECDAIPMPPVLMAMDACEGMVMGVPADMRTDGTCANAYTITRTWTFADECGNSSSVSQMISVQDMTVPEVTCTEFATTFSGCPDPIGPNTPSGNWLSVPPNGMIGTAVGGVYTSIIDLSTCLSDNCSSLDDLEYMISDSYSENRVPGCSVDIINEFMIRDECGNVSPVKFNFRGTIQFDGPAPVITCPAGVTVECSDPTDPANTGMATATSDCGTPAITFMDAFVTTCGNAGVITRTWTATDGCGTTSTCMQIITIEDTVAPVVTVPPNAEVDCGEDTSPAATGMATANDDCQGVLPTTFMDVSDVTQCDGGTIIRTWRSEDACGNADSLNQTITVLPPAAPIIVCPADMIVECFADIMTNPDDAIVTTECGLGFNTVITGPVQNGQTDCPGTTYTFTYTTTDDCGRTASCEQVFTIQNLGPIIVCPADQVVSCFEDIVADPSNLTVTTSCGLGFIAYVKQPLISGGIPGCNGTVYTYIYKVKDDCGRSAQCEQQFLIQNDAPTVTVPAGGVVECFSDIEVDVSDATVVVDCPDHSFNVYLLGPVLSGPIDCPGTTYTYTYRVRDNCDRTVEVERVFTNGQNAAPIIEAPEDATVKCLGGVNVNPDHATVTTSCGGDGYEVEVTGPQIIGSLDCPGTRYRYTYTVTDECGRSASDIRTFTVGNDGPEFYGCQETPLQFNCEDYGGEAGTIAAIEAYIASVEAYSACGDQLTVFNNFNSNNINTCINNGTNSITFRATDNCGRTSLCTTTYIVVDTEAPTIFEEAEDHWEICNYNTSDNFDDWVDNHGGAEAYDGCSTDNVFWSTIPANPSFECLGAPGMTSATVTFVVRDNCGNSTSTTATFSAFMNGGDFVEQGGPSEIEGQETIAMELFQNRPNPFKSETVISFNLPESQKASLTIFDLSGKLLKTYEGDFAQGYNEVTVHRNALPSTGVLIYRLTTETNSAVRKMILSE